MGGGDYQRRNRASLVGPASQGVCLISMLRKAMFQEKKGMGISTPGFQLVSAALLCGWAGAFSSLTLICKMKHLG